MVQKLFESFSVRTITPNGTPTSVLYLHNLDQQVFFPTEVLFFYKPLEQPTQDVVELLESSLKELLVSYHFAAGRCRVNEHEKRMELVCNHAGVPFAGASANLSIHDLGDLQTPNPMFRNFVLYPEAPSLEETPLLTVQVTKFTCGGFAVGICGNHAILDGVGLSNLFRDYSMIARGEKLTVLPNPDKTFLRPRPIPSPTFPHNELVGLPDAPVKFTYNPKESGELSAKHTFKTFTFTPDMIQSLKNKVLSEGLLKRCSTLEVVTAHIWQARTKVMGLKPEEPSKLFLVVDFRKALKSLVPRGFPGNAVICAPCVETSSQEVCENSFAFCVDKVQRTIRNVTEEYIRSEVDWCEINHGVIDLPGGLLFTTWSKLGFEEIDFGWGKPAFAGPVVHNKTEFVVMFSNCQEAGALNLSVALEYDKMEEFEKHVAI